MLFYHRRSSFIVGNTKSYRLVVCNFCDTLTKFSNCSSFRRRQFPWSKAIRCFCLRVHAMFKSLVRSNTFPDSWRFFSSLRCLYYLAGNIKSDWASSFRTMSIYYTALHRFITTAPSHSRCQHAWLGVCGSTRPRTVNTKPRRHYQRSKEDWWNQKRICTACGWRKQRWFKC